MPSIAATPLLLSSPSLFPPCLVPLAYFALPFLLRVSRILGIDIPIFSAFRRCTAQQCYSGFSHTLPTLSSFSPMFRIQKARMRHYMVLVLHLLYSSRSP